MSEEELLRLGRRVAEIVAAHLHGLPAAPVFRPYPRELAAELAAEPVPRRGAEPDEVLAEFERKILPWPMGNGHPRFFAWVNSPPAPIGVLAEALAAAMDPSCAGGNHAAVHLEHQVLRWFRELLGFPPEGGGLLVSGGSMASLTALAAARHARAGFDVGKEGLQGGRAPLVLYLSSQGHGCLRKAARVLGIGSDHVREVPVDGDFRMDVAALERAIAADRERGARPFAVCASAGAVNTGAIDPLAEIAAVARRADLWFHVDGAYGAPALLGREYAAELRDVALADSLALDPHKWLGVPVEAGLVLVRRAETLRAAFQLQAAYVPSGSAGFDEIAGPPWFSDFGFQQTRGFRALKVWAVLKHLGVEGLARRIDEAIRLARLLHARVLAEPELEPLAPQSLSVVCFRFAPSGLRGDERALDGLNQSLLRRVQLDGEAFLSGTRLGERFALRACIVNDRTRESDVEALVAAILRHGRAAARA